MSQQRTLPENSWTGLKAKISLDLSKPDNRDIYPAIIPTIRDNSVITDGQENLALFQKTQQQTAHALKALAERENKIEKSLESIELKQTNLLQNFQDQSNKWDNKFDKITHVGEIQSEWNKQLTKSLTKIDNCVCQTISEPLETVSEPLETEPETFDLDNNFFSALGAGFHAIILADIALHLCIGFIGGSLYIILRYAATNTTNPTLKNILRGAARYFGIFVPASYAIAVLNVLTNFAFGVPLTQKWPLFKMASQMSK